MVWFFARYVSDSLFRFQKRFSNMGVRASLCAQVVLVHTRARGARVPVQSPVQHEKSHVVLPGTVCARAVVFALRTLLLQVCDSIFAHRQAWAI